jgi:hypothetical protein
LTLSHFPKVSLAHVLGLAVILLLTMKNYSLAKIQMARFSPPLAMSFSITPALDRA